MVPWGRSFEEYQSMFTLSENDLKKNILGCGDGPAAFNAELTARGGNVISIDPVYQFDRALLEQRIGEVYDEILPQMELTKERYVWTNITSVEALGEVRMSAMERFLTDYEAGKTTGRYRNESLPKLSFEDCQFELALCSHFLFLYSEQLGFEDHLAAILELCRVAREVRIYPLLSLNGGVSPHLKKVVAALERRCFTVQQVAVDYQFQKGATHMLVIKSRTSD